MYKYLSAIALLGIGSYTFMRQSKFGRLPRGNRKSRVEDSPNYKKGKFYNLSHTPAFSEGANYFTVIKKLLTENNPHSAPKNALPSVNTNLKNLGENENVLVWFGHSSYFFQADGKKILVDPVFSGHASPVTFSTPAFPGSNNFSAEDMPKIDYLFITHDHWDHLDYHTVKQLLPKVQKIITGLGTGEHLESWGFDPNKILEKDWNEEFVLDEGFVVNTVPTRHFSGRGFKRNTVLWTSFALKTPSLNIFIGGDSGYDTHFKEAGKKFGPFDLVILENGQYNKDWKYIHMMPEETLQAAQDLNAEKLLPVHNSKFALARHAWYEPLETITNLHKNEKLKLLTPLIGEKVFLKGNDQEFSRWWQTAE